MINLKSTFYEETETQDIKQKYYWIKTDLIISTIDTDYENFLGSGDRDEVEFFNVHQ